MCWYQTSYNGGQKRFLRQIQAHSTVSVHVNNPGNVSPETVSASRSSRQQIQFLYQGGWHSCWQLVNCVHYQSCSITLFTSVRIVTSWGYLLHHVFPPLYQCFGSLSIPPKDAYVQIFSRSNEQSASYITFRQEDLVMNTHHCQPINLRQKRRKRKFSLCKLKVSCGPVHHKIS